jgi:flagellar protein FlaG
MNIETLQAARPPQRSQVAELAPRAERTPTDQVNPGAVENSAAINKSLQSEKDQSQKVLAELSVEEAVKRLTEFVSPTQSQISFSVDEESGIRVVKVLDKASQEVIRQFPSEEAIEIARALDKLQGLLIKDKA